MCLSAHFGHPEATWQAHTHLGETPPLTEVEVKHPSYETPLFGLGLISPDITISKLVFLWLAVPWLIFLHLLFFFPLLWPPSGIRGSRARGQIQPQLRPTPQLRQCQCRLSWVSQSSSEAINPAAPQRDLLFLHLLIPTASVFTLRAWVWLFLLLSAPVFLGIRLQNHWSSEREN